MVEKFEKLYKAQDIILNFIANLEEKELYLTGGTALNRFYLDGRYSEDLDFFTLDKTETAVVSIAKITKNLIKNFKNITVDVDSKYFKRLYADDGLKIDLVADRVPQVFKPILINGVYVDTMEEIFLNKLDALYSRSAIRDVYDLFSIVNSKKIDIEKALVNFDVKSANELNLVIEHVLNFDYEYFLKLYPKDAMSTIEMISPDKFENFKNEYKNVFTSTFEPFLSKDNIIFRNIFEKETISKIKKSIDLQA